MFYNIENDELFKYKDRLISRKIAKFDNTNWYMWGRKFYKSDKKRIYVNGKTRCKKPFFINDCTSYDGSILAIFPRKDVTSVELQLMCKKLNEMDWNKLGFVVDGRYIFSQRSLENSLISW
jgi:adenine-specific DNA-methyltransferase